MVVMKEATKTFSGGITAVNQVSLHIAKGENVGLIGVNGAGKTTLIKMICGLYLPTSGFVRVFRENPFGRQGKRPYIGMVAGQLVSGPFDISQGGTMLRDDLSVELNFRLVKAIYKIPDDDYGKRLSDLSAALGLTDLLHYPVNRLSLGQRMKTELAAVLLFAPELLILDEPFIGIDAAAKETIRQMLREIAKDENITMILTTHNVEEIERICPRVVFLRDGSVMYNGSFDRLKRSHIGLNSMRVAFDGTPPDLQDFPISRYTVDNNILTLSYDSGILNSKDISNYLMASGKVRDILITKPSVEEIIRELYKEGNPTYVRDND